MARRRDEEAKFDRRGFFRFGLRKAAETVADTVSGMGEAFAEYAGELRVERRGVAPQPLRYESRPPGAVAGKQFEELCTKCGDCIEVCPAWAIQKSRDGSGYPVVEPNHHACALCEDPLPCIQSCETGALTMLPRGSVRLGLARLDASRCVVPQGQDCDFCVLYCPIPDEAIRMSDEGPVIIESGCTGCGMCAVMCPESAIVVRE